MKGLVMKLFAPFGYVMGKIFIKKFFKTLKTLAEGGDTAPHTPSPTASIPVDDS